MSSPRAGSGLPTPTCSHATCSRKRPASFSRRSPLLIPQYVLAEVTLSFLGLGVSEPMPSWGSLLSSLQQYYVLSSYWWMFLPAILLIPVFLLFYMAADALQEQAGVRPALKIPNLCPEFNYGETPSGQAPSRARTGICLHLCVFVCDCLRSIAGPAAGGAARW